ncbi:MAG: LuxR C-terminal-related transcriptional regulator [Bacteroidia bacterium]
MFVSGHTVRTHIKNIYKKLHANSRAEAVKKALKDKLI